MAKSLRSKSKLQAKSVKRKGEFSKYVDDRNKRIAAKLAEETKKQDEIKKQDKKVNDNDDKSMDVDENKDKKVSTSGWRDSRSQVYKQRQLKNKKRKTLKF